MVKRATNKAEDLPAAKPPRHDRGATFIELLVAIVLIGTAVLGILAALRATLIGSKIERDHSRAHEWLQSASEVLANDVPWTDCSTINTGDVLRDLYEDALRAEGSIVPEPWQVGQISVPSPVTFGQPNGTYNSTCHSAINRELITIRVVGPDNKIIETVDVVKVP
jgi:hypothetical protein